MTAFSTQTRCRTKLNTGANMKEIQKEIGQWHREKFGETTDDLLSAIMEKVGEECEEMADAHCLSGFVKTSHELPTEAADVAIALMAYCDRRGIDLEWAVLAKMRVNWCREWKRNEAGEWVREKE
jgi:NTP pyrophosphatase (non-canonical NTP hydrolase)